MNTYTLKELIGNSEYAKALEYLEYWQANTKIFYATYSAYINMVRKMMGD